MYRKFWLQVGDKKYDLLEKSFLNEPKGLGFKKNYSFYTLGSKEIVTSQSYEFPQISGDIVFYKGNTADKYKDYQELLSFIKNEDVRLYYQTPNSFESYYCEGIITQLDKTEVSKDGLLTCPFTFNATTFWRNSEQRKMVAVNVPIEDKGKTYDLERDYSYSSGTFDNIELTNRGYESVGFELEIIGNCTDPKLSLSKDGITYGVVQMIGNFDYVYINSKDGEEEIRLIKNGVNIVNPISYQNMSLADGFKDITFLKLKTGTSSAVFTPFDFNGEVIVSWYDTFVSI